MQKNTRPFFFSFFVKRKGPSFLSVEGLIQLNVILLVSLNIAQKRVRGNQGRTFRNTTLMNVHRIPFWNLFLVQFLCYFLVFKKSKAQFWLIYCKNYQKLILNVHLTIKYARVLWGNYEPPIYVRIISANNCKGKLPFSKPSTHPHVKWL